MVHAALTSSTRLAANSISMRRARGRKRTPWIPAKRFITCHGLSTSWSGFTWLNPPFGPRNGIVPWLEKFFSHA